MGKYATKEQLTDLVANMASKINIASGTQGVSGSYVPIGFIEGFMGISAPPDFLECDGSLHSIASYPQLADHFYEQFGASNYFGGNGTTTFAVPDLRGEFLRGTGTNSHTNQGDVANVGVHQDATEFPHLASDSGSGPVFVYKTNKNEGDTNLDSTPKSSVGRSNISGEHGGQTDRAGTFTSRPTNTSILWCITAIDKKYNPHYVDYSTEEQALGTWVDGRQVYQKTFVGTGSSTNDSTSYYTIGVASQLLPNVREIVDVAAFVNVDGFIDYNTRHAISIASNLDAIRIGQAVTSSQKSFAYNMTVRYTKTV